MFLFDTREDKIWWLLNNSTTMFKSLEVFLYACFSLVKRFNSLFIFKKKCLSILLFFFLCFFYSPKGNYEDALRAYEVAQDMDSIVRVVLFHLDNPEKVFFYCSRHNLPKKRMHFIHDIKNIFFKNNKDMRSSKYYCYNIFIFHLFVYFFGVFSFF